jgi:hypothetical protein
MITGKASEQSLFLYLFTLSKKTACQETLLMAFCLTKKDKDLISCALLSTNHMSYQLFA